MTKRGLYMNDGVRARAVCLLGVVASATAACGAPAPRPRMEDRARRDVPIAICRKALAASDTYENGALRPEVYWATLFPTFQGFTSPLESTARDCVGDALFSPEMAAANASAAPNAPVAVVAPTALLIAPTQSTVGRGEEGIQAVWLRSAAAPAKMSDGLLALVRQRPTELDVHAIGVYRGSAAHSRFGFAKMGARPALVAWSDACADGAAGVECENTLTVYFTSGGQLVVGANATTERVQFGTMKDVGRVKWRLTTDPPLFDGKSMKIKEKLTARDAREDEIRKLEGQRIYMLKGNELVPTGESLWTKVDRP